MQLLKGTKAALDPKAIRNDSALQRFLLTWVYSIIWKGKCGTLQQDELRMPQDQATELVCTRFDAAWNAEKQAAGQGGRPSLKRALWKAFGWQFVLTGVWKMAWSVFVILGAFYFTRSIIDFIKPLSKDRNAYNRQQIGDDKKGVGWILSVAFFIDSWFVGVALQRMADCATRLGIKLRACLMARVYQKLFKMGDVYSEDGGNVVSLVSTDCSKVYDGVQALHNVWTAPFEASAIIALLLWLTGVQGLPALGIVLVVLPLQYYFGVLIARFRSETIEISDGRVLRMHEVLMAIKLVKFYVWEDSFAKQVAEIRSKELAMMFWSALVKTINLCLVFAVPPVIALAIYATSSFTEGRIEATVAFTVLSLFNTLRFPLVVLPKALRGSSEAIAALKRLEQFLLQPELEVSKPLSDTQVLIVRTYCEFAPWRMFLQDKAVLVHPSNPKEFELKVDHFDVAPGQVVAIVGRVGSGKSSVFEAILGNMTTLQGSLQVGGKIAYVPQTPWVQNLTLRDNILFGLPYNEEKYKKVIHACALELDLQILPAGDQSMAGERGINLSGGQRQRVCLARAVYHDADIVLLDNPLSAVDQHTSKHIFDHCIRGLLKDKAVILIAHQLELLPLCHRTSIMVDSSMVYFGPYNPAAISTFMPVDHLLHATVEAGEAATLSPKEEDARKTEEPSEEFNMAKAMLERAERSGSRRMSIERSSSQAMKEADSVAKELNVLAETLEAASRTPSKISSSNSILDRLKDEDPEIMARQFNGVPKRMDAGKAAFIYFKSGGMLLGALSLLIFMTTQTTRVYSDLWIRQWVADMYHLYPNKGAPNFDSKTHWANKVYILAYMGFVFGFIIQLLLRDSIFSWFALRAATHLHNTLFTHVLQAPILFFLRTPVGDVLKSFSKDQDTIDEVIVDTMHMTTIYTMILLTTLAIVTVSVHFYALTTVGLFLAFALVMWLYLPAATVLKRWVGATSSAVYVHVDESLSGMKVIRAFDCMDFFVQENIQRINAFNLALFNNEQAQLWLAFWCDLVGALLVVITALLVVDSKGHLDAAAAGLAVSNSIQLLVFFTWVVRGCAEVVFMWDAVERITTLATNVPSELDHQVATQEHPDAGRKVDVAKKYLELVSTSTQDKIGTQWEKDKAGQAVSSKQITVEVITDAGRADLEHWPSSGDIQFVNVCLRYFPGAPLALRGVSFHIMDQEKIGIVGRTGSGKTTLLMALFRMFNLAGGHILVDGKDIAQLPLQEVRKRLAIIPQEPVMFKGTVRSNLDPFAEATDAELWRALNLVHLKHSIEVLPGGLDAAVAEGGSNFSLGQKQLVCMARCVLKKTRVLVLDEATAAMDLQTDTLIQKTIRKVFKDRTTVTIAHRLDTIIFSDRILAMQQGEALEFDNPKKLLQNPASMFHKLVEDTGPQASLMLRRMVHEGPQDAEDEEEEQQQQQASTRTTRDSVPVHKAAPPATLAAHTLHHKSAPLTAAVSGKSRPPAGSAGDTATSTAAAALAAAANTASGDKLFSGAAKSYGQSPPAARKPPSATSLGASRSVTAESDAEWLELSLPPPGSEPEPGQPQ